MNKAQERNDERERELARAQAEAGRIAAIERAKRVRMLAREKRT